MSDSNFACECFECRRTLHGVGARRRRARVEREIERGLSAEFVVHDFPFRWVFIWYMSGWHRNDDTIDWRRLRIVVISPHRVRW